MGKGRPTLCELPFFFLFWENNLELLTAVNLVLPKLGEHPVTNLDVNHPTLAVILPEVDNSLTELLLKGWWFNEYETTLYPDSEKHIALGVDVLSFIPYYTSAAVRGSELFNTSTLSYDWDSAVEGRITQRVEFDKLPESAAQFVWYNALISAYVTDLGVTQDVQVWQVKAGAAYTQLLAEHLRNKKYSTTKSRRYQRLRSAMRA